MGIASPNLSVQNWYSDSLASAAGSSDNILSLNNLPTPTEGFLIIDPNNTSTREVIHYTGKTSGAVTGVTRGLDGTSAQAHAQNTTVSMMYTSSHWLALQDGSALSSTALTPTKTYNPYKFSVYRNNAYTTVNGTTTKMPFDTKSYDTGNNVDVTTNVGRFTALVAGFYHFSAGMHTNSSTAQFTLMLYKNGAEIKRLFDETASGAYLIGGTGGGDLQLAANDYIEVFYYLPNAIAVTTGSAFCYFDGLLTSGT